MFKHRKCLFFFSFGCKTTTNILRCDEIMQSHVDYLIDWRILNGSHASCAQTVQSVKDLYKMVWLSVTLHVSAITNIRGPLMDG